MTHALVMYRIDHWPQRSDFHTRALAEEAAQFLANLLNGEAPAYSPLQWTTLTPNRKGARAFGREWTLLMQRIKQ